MPVCKSSFGLSLMNRHVSRTHCTFGADCNLSLCRRPQGGRHDSLAVLAELRRAAELAQSRNPNPNPRQLAVLSTGGAFAAVAPRERPQVSFVFQTSSS